MNNDLKERIRRHEGCVLTPYEDSEGILTVGVGRNLRDVPFSEGEVALMFENDLRRAQDGAESMFPYSELNEVRRGVLIEMVFQMGVHGVSKFKRFLSACLEHHWGLAADEMLDSKWAKQTPERANELSDIFRKGEIA